MTLQNQNRPFMGIDKDEPGLCMNIQENYQKTMYDQTGLYKKIQDPQELYNFIRYLIGPGKTLWTIHNHRRLYKTLRDHTESKRTIS